MIDRKKRNEDILNACADVFYEKGIEKATMRNFSEAIGYSPATIYQSFKDKREIVKNCLYFCADQRDELISEILRSNIDTPENLLLCLREKKAEIMKWSLIILRIITSPYYQEMQEEINTISTSVTGNFEKEYDSNVFALFMLYYSVMMHFVISGDDHTFQLEEAFLDKAMKDLLKK
ncbi:MAG: TetR/AcrR family transcriptional regulator [Clostridia bacterium]